MWAPLAVVVAVGFLDKEHIKTESEEHYERQEHNKRHKNLLNKHKQCLRTSNDCLGFNGLLTKFSEKKISGPLATL